MHASCPEANEYASEEVTFELNKYLGGNRISPACVFACAYLYHFNLKY